MATNLIVDDMPANFGAGTEDTVFCAVQTGGS